MLRFSDKNVNLFYTSKTIYFDCLNPLKKKTKDLLRPSFSLILFILNTDIIINNYDQR